MSGSDSSVLVASAHEADRAAQRQRADVAHEHLRRVGVEPEEPDPGAPHRAAEDRQLAGAGDVRHAEVVGDVEVAQRCPGRVGEQEQREGADDHRPDRQPVEAVGEVDGVRLGHQHEDGEGDVGGQRERQRQVWWKLTSGSAICSRTS